ncbi:MAG: hypothetical protein RIS70_177 [Planctomycetota bacterium]
MIATLFSTHRAYIAWLAMLLATAAALPVRAQSPPRRLPMDDSSIAKTQALGELAIDLDHPAMVLPEFSDPNDWTWQILPSSLIYKSYLAGVKESRFASQHVNLKGDGWIWDATLGTRVGLVRFGDQDPIRPNGFQIDAEGSAQVRLDIPDDVNVRAVDFRGGVPITYGYGPSRFKLGFYHLSSHLGDEFLLQNPGYDRLNYARDVLVAGYSHYLTPDFRLYGEVGWAFHSDVSEPWEFQFGVDYAPGTPTGIRGRPFFAVNGQLRQEVDYGGNFVAQAGWAWLSNENARLLRLGAQYFNGYSAQFSFYNRFEQYIGLAVWYDF